MLIWRRTFDPDWKKNSPQCMETSILLFSVLLVSWCLVEGQLAARSVSSHPASISVTRANPEAKRLYEELIKVRSYNKLIRPVKNNSEKLTVYLGLRLNSITRCGKGQISVGWTVFLNIAFVSVVFEGRKESDYDLERVAQAGTRTICFSSKRGVKQFDFSFERRAKRCWNQSRRKDRVHRWVGVVRR